MSGARHRVLMCVTARCRELVAGLRVANRFVVDLRLCDEQSGLVPAIDQAIDDKQPFEVVVVEAARLGAEAGEAVAAVLRADPHISIVVLDDRGAPTAAASTDKRVTYLPLDLDAECASAIVAALARCHRVQFNWTAAKNDLDAMQRAYRVVSSEFQRQNKRLQEHEAALRHQNERFDAALNNMSQGLCMFDSTARLVVCNKRYVEMYGLSPQVVTPGLSLRALLEHRKECGFSGDVGEYHAYIMAEVAKRIPTSQIVESADGRTVALAHQPMSGGGWVVTHEDITERTRAEAKIKHMARHDALTDLPNRVAFREQMEQALVRVRRGDKHAVLCIDLDQFKSVNDTLGHGTGDALLRAVTQRLRDCVREVDTVARLGGDEFAILQIGIERPENAGTLAQRVIDLVGEPYDLDGHQVVIGASIGIALTPNDGTLAEQLLRNADMALYRAKTDGRATYSFFEPDMDAQLQARRALELDLRRGLVENQFDIYYQPLLNVQTEEITSCEALLRWRHPVRGTVAPNDFIALAEEIGLILPLGEWVLRQACAEAATWPNSIKVAVNLSAVQFKNRNLVQVVVNALGQSGLLPGRLELEITESVLLNESETTLATLHQLRNLGISISMDDFGTGYSSLSYLRSFPFDKIKIDRSFVRDLSPTGDCAAIIRAVAGLGRGLGIVTAAEGVETREQLEHIRAEGCTEVQGYLFSPPTTAAAVRDFIAQRNAGSRAA